MLEAWHIVEFGCNNQRLRQLQSMSGLKLSELYKLAKSSLYITNTPLKLGTGSSPRAYDQRTSRDLNGPRPGHEARQRGLAGGDRKDDTPCSQNMRMLVTYCFALPFSSLDRVARYGYDCLVRIPLDRQQRGGTKNKRLNRPLMAASRGFSIKRTRRPLSAQVLAYPASGRRCSY